MQENKSLLDARKGGYCFAGMIALYVILSFIGQAVFSAILGENSTAYVAVCSLFSVISMSGVLFYAVYGLKINVAQFTGDNFGIIGLPLASIISCGMFMGLGYINTTVANIFVDMGLKVSSINVPLDSVWHLLLFSILLAVFPAIVEELFFRGLLIGSLKNVKSHFAVLVSALCFALYHSSVAQLVYQFVYGVALGYLFVIAKSIVPCIFAHFVNNFAVLCFEYFKVNVDLFNPIIIAIGSACLAVFATVVYFVYRKRAKMQTDQDKIKVEKGEIKRFFFPTGIFAIIICLTLAIGGLFA